MPPYMIKQPVVLLLVPIGLTSVGCQRSVAERNALMDQNREAQAEIDRLRRKKNDKQPGRLEVPIASAITEVRDGSVAYRGHPIDELTDVGFEAVADLLWSGELTAAGAWPHDDHIATAVRPAIDALGPTATPVDRMMAGVVAAAAADPFRADRSAHGVTTSARVLVRTIVDALPRRAEPAGERIADRLWSRLTADDPMHADLLDLALTLLADHGMATSTLAARLAASTRAAPHAVLLAGLGAVSGPLHGAASGVVHDLFEHAEVDGPDAAIATVIERDGKVPGFGHFIHRTTDPRHDLLMNALAEADLPDERLDVVAAVVDRTATRIPVAPNVDLALGALTYTARMDRSAGEIVFAIARTSGWLAHALEEYDEAPIRFRPVGRYEPRPSRS
ncbi:MAG: citrate/2-methylcitrate synthase, partial [Actinomycetota bacterium]